MYVIFCNDWPLVIVKEWSDADAVITKMKKVDKGNRWHTRSVPVATSSEAAFKYCAEKLNISTKDAE